VNYFRKTFKTVSDAEEEFSIDYEDICTTNISDDSGFIEVSTPSTPATPYSCSLCKQTKMYKYLLPRTVPQVCLINSLALNQ
jgi:hypothetical protein